MRLRVMAHDATGACHDKRDVHALVLQLLLWTCSPKPSAPERRCIVRDIAIQHMGRRSAASP
jgi:hypothetical protein